jgi:hypothetical protein
MIDMGLGKLGFDNAVFKRKFRYTLEIQEICGGQTIPKDYVKLAARPNISIEETEINFLHGKTWIPGKGTWETITVTYFDMANVTDNLPLYTWLASVYEFTDPIRLRMGSSRRDYSGRAILTLYDGCGEPVEEWTLDDVWPTAINWGDLDYSNSEECTIELTLRYSQVRYRSVCPPFVPGACCTPCGTGGSANGASAQSRAFPDTTGNIAF